MHEKPAEPEAAPGPDIRGYQVVEALGSGGMGLVYRALQVSTGREVALKILKTSVLGSPTAVARFKREVQLAARLEHPNIARIYDADVQQGLCFYSMQLIRGLPLHDYVAEHLLSRRQILELMLAVCRGVAYAHAQDVVHRDLKPSNIFVDETGAPFLLDFGLAKALGSEAADFAISLEGTVTGTPGFMAPEQAAGQISRIAKATDVYSLGAILYYLLTNHFPHEISGTQYDVLRRIAEEDVTPPDVYASGLAPELTALLRRALQHEPENRFPDAGAMAAEIERCLTLDTAELEHFAYSGPHRAWPWWIAAGVAVVVAGITVSLAILASQTRQKNAPPATPSEAKLAPAAAQAPAPPATPPNSRGEIGGRWPEAKARMLPLLAQKMAAYTAEHPLHLAKPPDGVGVLMPEMDAWMEDQTMVLRSSDGAVYRCRVAELEPRTAMRLLMVLAKHHPEDTELRQFAEALRRHPQNRPGRPANGL